MFWALLSIFVDTKQTNIQDTSPPLRLTDKAFILFMLCMTCVVATMGYTTYQRGKIEEASKRNGEAWLKWMSESANNRQEPGFLPAACAAQSPPIKQVWADCFESITTPEGPMGKLTNPFSGGRLQRVVKCDPQDKTLAGSLVFDKYTPTPPGSAVATLLSALADSDNIGEKIQIRLSVCAKDASVIRIGELEF